MEEDLHVENNHKGNFPEAEWNFPAPPLSFAAHLSPWNTAPVKKGLRNDMKGIWKLKKESIEIENFVWFKRAF